jgi:hypothetical protein
VSIFRHFGYDRGFDDGTDRRRSVAKCPYPAGTVEAHDYQRGFRIGRAHMSPTRGIPEHAEDQRIERGQA